MEEEKTERPTQLSVFTWITLLFIVLKLAGVITWSWWWVLSPWWIPFCFYFCLGCVYYWTRNVR